MTKTIQIFERGIVDYIESLSYEVMTRKDIISYMLSSNMDTNSEAFNKYHKEYEEFAIQYDEAKKQLAKEYISDDIKSEFKGNYSWHLDFESAILKVTSKE